MTTKEKERRRRLTKRYNIQFRGFADEDEWPVAHKTSFQNIKKLGQTDFNLYRGAVTVDSDECPWREQTRSRAERIARLAKICLDGRKNEAGWRMSLESEVLARFTIEVAW